MEILINRKFLLACNVAAATKDDRYYLNGVCVEATPAETRVIGTDGSMLLATRFACINDTGHHIANPLMLIIPRDTIAQIKAKGADTVRLKQAADEVWQIVDGAQLFDFAPVDGKYPDYRRVIPLSVSGEAANFQLCLLSRFEKIAKILGHQATFLHQNGPNNGALLQVYGEPNVIGVIMPVRETEKCKTPDIPSWPQERE